MADDYQQYIDIHKKMDEAFDYKKNWKWVDRFKEARSIIDSSNLPIQKLALAWNDMYSNLFEYLRRNKAKGMADSVANRERTKTIEDVFQLENLDLFDNLADLRKNHKGERLYGMDVGDDSLTLHMGNGNKTYYTDDESGSAASPVYLPVAREQPRKIPETEPIREISDLVTGNGSGHAYAGHATVDDVKPADDYVGAGVQGPLKKRRWFGGLRAMAAGLAGALLFSLYPVPVGNTSTNQQTKEPRYTVQPLKNETLTERIEKHKDMHNSVFEDQSREIALKKGWLPEAEEQAQGYDNQAGKEKAGTAKTASDNSRAMAKKKAAKGFSFTQKSDIQQDWEAYLSCKKPYSDLGDKAKQWFGSDMVGKYDKDSGKFFYSATLHDGFPGAKDYEVFLLHDGNGRKLEKLVLGKKYQMSLTDEQLKAWEQGYHFPFQVIVKEKGSYTVVSSFDRKYEDPCGKAKEAKAAEQPAVPKSEAKPEAQPPATPPGLAIVRKPHTPQNMRIEDSLSDLLKGSVATKVGGESYDAASVPYEFNGKRGTLGTMPDAQSDQLIAGMKYRLSNENPSLTNGLPEVRHVLLTQNDEPVYAHKNNGTTWRQAVDIIMDSKRYVNVVQNAQIIKDWVAGKKVGLKKAWKHGTWDWLTKKNKELKHWKLEDRTRSYADYNLERHRNFLVRSDLRRNYHEPDMKPAGSFRKFVREAYNHLHEKISRGLVHWNLVWDDRNRDGVMQLPGELRAAVLTPATLGGEEVNEPVSNLGYYGLLRVGLAEKAEPNGGGKPTAPAPTPAPSGVHGGETAGNTGAK